MKKYLPLIFLWLLFAAVATSCTAHKDSCGAYNRGGGRSGSRSIPH